MELGLEDWPLHLTHKVLGDIDKKGLVRKHP